MLALLLTAAAIAKPAVQPEKRTVELEIIVSVAGLPSDTPVNVYLPIAQDAARQTVKRTDINANIVGVAKTEPKYGNQYWHGQTDHAPDGTVTVNMVQRIERSSAGRMTPTEAEKGLFVQANSRVPISGTSVDKAISALGSNDGSPKGIARSIYNMVIDTMDHKTGNCTDFNGLFASTARAKDIPTRFEVGYTIPIGQQAGTIEGHHCWVETALPTLGWFPIDPYAADKDPEQKEALFGKQPADRIELSVGRDLNLENLQSPPIDFFIDPHVEVDGKPWKDVSTTVTYRTPSPN